MRVVCIAVMLLSLSGCQLLQNNFGSQAPIETSTGTYLCETDSALETYEEFCHLRAWSEFIIDADQVTWTERNASVKSLGSEPKQKLQKVLLSQGIDTPYINRLRAQKWLTELKSGMDNKMAQVLQLMIEEPSQQMLELESAISILSQVNTRQEKSISELQETVNTRTNEIQKQREQVQQLLQIEANMSDEKRSN
ncbi:hypothetical protein [Glaciecola sp. SC05]|uniref:hypothetical protein n=1 Tax=Glaciecola sp. SC05 TaxID=1987355 RepID=UPI003528B441